VLISETALHSRFHPLGRQSGPLCPLQFETKALPPGPMSLNTPRWALGPMSRTSLDGIDAALIRSDGRRQVETGPALTVPYDPDFRACLRDVLNAHRQNCRRNKRRDARDFPVSFLSMSFSIPAMRAHAG